MSRGRRRLLKFLALVGLPGAAAALIEYAVTHEGGAPSATPGSALTPTSPSLPDDLVDPRRGAVTTAIVATRLTQTEATFVVTDKTSAQAESVLDVGTATAVQRVRFCDAGVLFEQWSNHVKNGELGAYVSQEENGRCLAYYVVDGTVHRLTEDGSFDGTPSIPIRIGDRVHIAVNQVGNQGTITVKNLTTMQQVTPAPSTTLFTNYNQATIGMFREGSVTNPVPYLQVQARPFTDVTINGSPAARIDRLRRIGMTDVLGAVLIADPGAPVTAPARRERPSPSTPRRHPPPQLLSMLRGAWSPSCCSHPVLRPQRRRSRDPHLPGSGSAGQTRPPLQARSLARLTRPNDRGLLSTERRAALCDDQRGTGPRTSLASAWVRGGRG